MERRGTAITIFKESKYVTFLLDGGYRRADLACGGVNTAVYITPCDQFCGTNPYKYTRILVFDSPQQLCHSDLPPIFRQLRSSDQDEPHCPWCWAPLLTTTTTTTNINITINKRQRFNNSTIYGNTDDDDKQQQFHQRRQQQPRTSTRLNDNNDDEHWLTTPTTNDYEQQQ
jgi:hypothetical protein